MSAKKLLVAAVQRCNATLNEKENFDPEQGKDENSVLYKELLELKTMMETLLKQQARSNIMMEQILKRDQKKVLFPVENINDLEKINEELKESRDSLLPGIKSITAGKGVVKSLNNLLSNNLIKDMNYDGVKGKISFKKLKNLDEALFDACKKDGYSYKYHEEAMRKAFKLAKGRLYKRESLQRKTAEENNGKF